MVISSSWSQGGKGELPIEFQFFKMKELWRVFSFFYNTVNILNIEPYTEKWSTVIFVFYIKKEFYINGIAEYATF